MAIDTNWQLNYPTGKGDTDGLIKFANELREVAPTYRLDVERSAMGNILFWLGLHWTKFDSASRIYRPIRLKRRTPRPVTNVFASIVASSASRLVAYKPPLSINPGSGEADDIASAEVGDKIRQIVEKEARVREHKPLAALWTLLTGNCFLTSSYDLGPQSGKKFVPFDRCLLCEKVSSPVDIEASGGTCPQCGESQQFEMAVEPNGKPIGVDRPMGRHYLELHNVFQMYYDYEVPMLEDSPYVMISETQSVQWVKETFGKDVAAKVEVEHGAEDIGEAYARSLSYTASGAGRYISSSGTRGEPHVRVARLMFRASDTYPDGVYATVLGGKIVEDNKDLPYHDEKGRPFIPVSHLKFDHVTGRVLGKTRCDDIRPKNEQRNRLEAILETHSRRMANSVWLLPDGVGVSRISGEQGQYLRYNSLVGVPPPSRVPGDNPPPYLVAWFPQIDAEMDNLFGSKEILRGDVPQGVSAYAAIALIDERARQGQSSLLENWALGWMKWTRQNLDIWREYATEERVLSTGFGTWEIEKFNNARFVGGVDVDIEVGESRPTTMVAKRAALEQAARTGALNVMDPIERYRYLEALGIPELMEDFKLDMREAERENDEFKQLGIMASQMDPTMQQQGMGAGQMSGLPQIQPPMPWQNHALHIARHRRFIMSETYRKLPNIVRGMVLEHMMLHQEFLVQSQMQLRPGQAVPGDGAGPAGGGGSKGTAKGDQAPVDEAQNASPDTFTGGTGT